MHTDHVISPGYWFLVSFLAISILLMLAGQTVAVVNYDLAASLGLQETLEEVGAFGVQMNRAFGAGDSVVYIPLMVLSLVGLLRKRSWSIITTAAVAGVSLYWSITITFVLLFARGVPGYTLQPGLEYAVFLGAYAVFGLWCLVYLSTSGNGVLGREN